MTDVSVHSPRNCPAQPCAALQRATARDRFSWAQAAAQAGVVARPDPGHQGAGNSDPGQDQDQDTRLGSDVMEYKNIGKQPECLLV